MIIQFEKAAGGTYQGLIEDLFSLDRQEKPSVQFDQVLPHFTQMQSLIRATIEYCEVAFRETNLGHVYPARALLRSAFDHVILSSYLHKHQNGAKTTQLILDKNYRELAEKAKGAGAVDSGEKLLEIVMTDISENGKITTRTSNLIDSFQEKKLLQDFYFLLGQAVHPKAAFSQYIELDEQTGERRIRRSSLDCDASSVHPFTFQILAIAMLLDADTRKDQSLRDSILALCNGHCFGPELTV